MIETKRLILRPFSEMDADDYYSILKQSSVYKWLGQGEVKTKNQILKIINYYLSQWNQEGLGPLAVVLKDKHTLIGHCGFSFIKELDKYELMYAFDPNQWGKGYATEASKATLHWLKKNRNIDEIVALAYPNNKRSIHVINKLGFEYTETRTLFGAELFVFQLFL